MIHTANIHLYNTRSTCLVNKILRLSAAVLANHLNCTHFGKLSRGAAEGRLKKPRRHYPIAAILQQSVIEHEAPNLEHPKRSESICVVQIPEAGEREGLDRTRSTMRA